MFISVLNWTVWTGDGKVKENWGIMFTSMKLKFWLHQYYC